MINFNAMAFENFPEYFPAGFSESAMGNSGAALKGSPGNVIYNPGALAFMDCKSKNIVSGFSYSQLSIPLEPKGISTDAGSVITSSMLPALSATFFKINNARAGLFLYSSDQTLETKVSLVNDGKAFISSRTSSLFLGYSQSYRVSDTQSWGFTLNLRKDNILRNNYLSYSAEDSQETMEMSRFVHGNFEQVQFYAQLGYFQNVSTNYSIGVRLKSKGFKISSKGEEVGHELKSYEEKDGSHKPDVIQQYTTHTADYDHFPFDLLLGNAYRLNDHFEFLLDIGNQFADKYYWSDGQEYSYDNKLRLSFGTKYSLQNGNNILVGYLFRPNAQTGTDSFCKGYTLGYLIKEENTQTLLGAFWLMQTVDHQVNSGDLAEKLIISGVQFMTTYNF